jgi:hypothetical protein
MQNKSDKITGLKYFCFQGAEPEGTTSRAEQGVNKWLRENNLVYVISQQMVVEIDSGGNILVFVALTYTIN